MNIQIESTGSDETEKIGKHIGRALRGGELIELVSDLGGGKTTFVRGLVQGAGSIDTVHSPSFTLANIYKAGPYTICHYDFYRLAEPGIIAHELAENVDDPKKIVVIEWAHVIQDVIAKPHVILHIQQTGENARHITIDYPKHVSYLFDGTS